MALLADLAAASRRVSETASRNAKIAELAACLRGLAPDEIPIAISFLTGETRQGKLGVAYAALRDGNWGASPPGPSLSVQEVDTAFAGLAATSGKGSAGGRAERLAALGLPGARVDIVLAHKIGLAGKLVVRSHINAGRLRLLGVGTPQRVRVLPDMPAIAETLGYAICPCTGAATIQAAASARTPLASPINQCHPFCIPEGSALANTKILCPWGPRLPVFPPYFECEMHCVSERARKSRRGSMDGDTGRDRRIASPTLIMSLRDRRGGRENRPSGL